MDSSYLSTAPSIVATITSCKHHKGNDDGYISQYDRWGSSDNYEYHHCSRFPKYRVNHRPQESLRQYLRNAAIENDESSIHSSNVSIMFILQRYNQLKDTTNRVNEWNYGQVLLGPLHGMEFPMKNPSFITFITLHPLSRIVQFANDRISPLLHLPYQ
jgi:hypothetical protein